MVKSYSELLIWQKAIKLVKAVYIVTESFPRKEMFGLTNQIRRAVVSIPSNIAEGQARNHTKEFVHFLHIALGSLAELDTQLIIAGELNYMTAEQLSATGSKILEMRKMICGILKKLPNGS